MKKLLVLLTSLSLILSLAACGGKKPQNFAVDLLPADASPATYLSALFTDTVNQNKKMGVEEIANTLLACDKLEFEGATMAVEEGYLSGFTSEITGFEEGIMFGPVIGSIPFVGYVFDVKDDVNVADFMETLNNSADLRWNICTEADESACTSVNDKVCFIMSPLSFDE